MKPMHSRHPLRVMLSAAAVLVLTACADMSGISPQASLHDNASLGLPVTAGETVLPSAVWWQDFGDKQLNTLMDQALLANPSLAMARARLARAQAWVNSTTASTKPQLSGGVDATRQLYSANGMIPAPIGGSVYNSGTAQLSGGWELDFFGKNHAALEAALGQSRAAEADAQAARLLLATNVARSYFQWMRLKEQLGVAQRQLAQRQQAQRLVQDRVNAGLDTRLELLQSEGSLPEARLQIETLQEQLDLTQHALSALIGTPNRPLALESRPLAAIKTIVSTSNLPSDLLGRRPDIAAARWRVEAATHDVAGAKSQFYPNINLVAFAGFSSIGLDRLLDAGSQQWGAGPALHLPIFDGGRLRANLAGKTADLDAAIDSYNAAVIEAVRDVADQLSASQSVRRQQVEQRAAQTYAERAYAIALQRYEAGLGNYLNVLSAEATVLSQRRLEVDLAARSVETQLLLIRALGGGYRADGPTHVAQQ